jgi:hypothetical protein
MKFAIYSRQLCIACVLAISITACTSGDNAEQDVLVSEILQMNLKAVRGDTRNSGVRSTDKTVRISEADYTLVGRYRAAGTGLMRIDVFSGDDRVFSEGKDENGVWEWPGGQDKPVNVDHEGIGALEHGIEFNLFALAELGDRGHEVELVGKEVIRETSYYVLKITLADGFETYKYVNEETWLVDMSRNVRALHPGIDPTQTNIETRYDKWQRVDGVLFASRSRDFVQGSDTATQTGLVVDSTYDVPPTDLDLDRTYVPDGPPITD